MKKRTTAKWMTFSAVFGAVIGAVTALLYSPKKGAALRKDLHKQFTIGKQEADKQIKKAFGAISPQAEEAYEEFKTSVAQKLEQVSVPLTKETYHDIVDAVASQLGDKRQDLKKGYDVLRKEWKRMYRRLTK